MYRWWSGCQVFFGGGCGQRKGEGMGWDEVCNRKTLRKLEQTQRSERPPNTPRFLSLAVVCELSRSNGSVTATCCAELARAPLPLPQHNPQPHRTTTTTHPSTPFHLLLATHATLPYARSSLSRCFSLPCILLRRLRVERTVLIMLRLAHTAGE